jgi:small multidrug resistance pump
MQKYHLYLIIEVVLEYFGTTAMKSSQQFTKLWPSVFTVIGLGGVIYMMTLTLKYMPLGIVYGFWSGLGIIFITAISVFYYKQPIDLWAIFGLVLIIIGIIIIQLFYQQQHYHNFKIKYLLNDLQVI